MLFDLEKFTAVMKAYHRRRGRLAHPETLGTFDLSATGHQIHHFVDREVLLERLGGGEDQLARDLKPRRHMSAAARKPMRRPKKKRWAEWHAKKR